MKTLDILLESIGDEEWELIKNKVEIKRTHRHAENFRNRRESAINF